jgi:hypothetical protein
MNNLKSGTHIISYYICQKTVSFLPLLPVNLTLSRSYHNFVNITTRKANKIFAFNLCKNNMIFHKLSKVKFVTYIYQNYLSTQ